MLQHADFYRLLGGLVEALPVSKALSEKGLTFAWTTFPPQAKEELDKTLFAYACTQRTLDPEPNLNLAIHIQLLTYLYPTIDSRPFFSKGLREDLPSRLQNPFVFHPINFVAAHQNPPTLRLQEQPASPAPWRLETPEQRRERLLRLAKQTGVNIPPP